jgi:hypothetical protein
MSTTSTATIVRRVRLELPQALESPAKEELEALPYSRWLQSHVEEIMGLLDANGKPLLCGAKSVSSEDDVPAMAVFVTDFRFPSQENFDYYKSNYVAVMRGRVAESYPCCMMPNSPFKYKFAISSENTEAEFAALNLSESSNVTVIAIAGDSK